MVVTISKRAPWNLGKQMLQIFPEPCEKCGLAACDLFVAPYIPLDNDIRFFSSPIKMFEYMAMGKGIVASDLEQMGEVLEHRKTAWLVKPGDVDALVEGLQALIADINLRKVLGENARKAVVAQYTWKHHTDKIIEALTSRHLPSG